MQINIEFRFESALIICILFPWSDGLNFLPFFKSQHGANWYMYVEYCIVDGVVFLCFVCVCVCVCVIFLCFFFFFFFFFGGGGEGLFVCFFIVCFLCVFLLCF